MRFIGYSKVNNFDIPYKRQSETLLIGVFCLPVFLSGRVTRDFAEHGSLTSVIHTENNCFSLR